MKKFYPKFLVFLQFGTIGAMLLSAEYHLAALPLAVSALGGAIGLWALAHNRRGNFNIAPELKKNCQLITTGAYRWIRHPMYASVTLMMLGVTLMDPKAALWLLWLFLVTILLLKAQREESLWLSHDPCYLEYRENTKYFIPYIL
jgi:protein-S-isoprenylcysteine O-methyltransferase Ste14